MSNTMSFDIWFLQLKELAEQKGCSYLIADQESYRDYFMEGETPEETLRDTLSYAVE